MTSFATATAKVTASISCTIMYMVKLRPSGAMRLRTRGHDYEPPAVKFDFNKRNFSVRSRFYYV